MHSDTGHETGWDAFTFLFFLYTLFISMTAVSSHHIPERSKRLQTLHIPALCMHQWLQLYTFPYTTIMELWKRRNHTKFVGTIITFDLKWPTKPKSAIKIVCQRMWLPWRMNVSLEVVLPCSTKPSSRASTPHPSPCGSPASCTYESRKC